MKMHRSSRLAATCVATFLLLGTASCAADDTDTPAQMTIDAGRLGVMMDQAARMLAMPDTRQGDGASEPLAILKNAVLQYQRVWPVACDRRMVDADVCRVKYDPDWLDDSDAPDAGELRDRIDEASDQIGPLWNGLCARVPEHHDPGLCQME